MANTARAKIPNWRPLSTDTTLSPTSATTRRYPLVCDKTSDQLRLRATTVLLAGRKHVVSRAGETHLALDNRDVQTIIRRKIQMNTARMVLPIVASDTMRIPMQIKSIPMGERGRIEVLTLRAREKFFGRPRYDNLMMLVEIELLPCERDQDIVFVRCVAFFRDAADEHFVAVHWYENAGRSPIDFKARLSKVKPMSPTSHDSYDIMPVGSILNGALLVQDRGIVYNSNKQQPQFWVRQSPREYNYLLDFYGIRPFVDGETQLHRDRL